MQKPLFSSSSSSTSISTSTTTTSIDESPETPLNPSSYGCISTMLQSILPRRKFLVSNSSDHHKYTQFCSSEKAKCSIDESIPTEESSGRINLVAKLMGLDSIPIKNFQKDLSAVTRSRSMNSAETWKGFEDMQRQPRRTKSSRDIPCFLELEDENFFILSFENETREASKMNRRESVYEKDKENMITKLNYTQKGVSGIALKDKTNVQDHKGKFHSGKKQFAKLREPLRKKKDSAGRKTLETDNNSQNSSPDSVLEDVQLPVNGNANCPEVSSRLISATSRRTLWEELENYIKQNNTRKNETSINNDQEATKNKQNGDISSNIVDFESKIHAKILKSSKVADEEMLKSKWILKDASKLEDYVEVGENLEAGILDQLMDELIDQLTDT